MAHYHPDDEPSPRFGNWADDFNTFEDACAFYGCDSPAQLRAEQEALDREAFDRQIDDIEINGARFRFQYPDDEIPF